LESEMAHNLSQYQCEWKTTLASPEKLKRFQHFVNSSEPDGKLSYVTERGQRRPRFKSERIEIVDVTE